MSILNYLNKPYPNNLNRWKITITISLFVSLFLVVFQPFGLINVQIENKLLILAGYGVVTFIVLLMNLFALPFSLQKVFKEENWTILKQIIWLSWIVLTIGTGNYFYSVTFDITLWFGFNGLIVFIIFTFLVALIPIIVITILSHNQLLRSNLAASVEMNNKISSIQNEPEGYEKLIITSENNKQQITTYTSKLICIESEGNYINIFYLENDHVTRKIVRSTLKNTENQIASFRNFNRCHRAFIVNVLFIENVKGNSQGYRLVMKHLDFEIPVSRNNSKKFKEFINQS